MKTLKNTTCNNTTPEGFYFSKNSIVSMFARWAIEQSPYRVPANLEIALANFYNELPETRDDILDWYWFDLHKDLVNLVTEAGNKVPEVIGWNNRRNGKEGMGFVSRYFTPSPDDDFVDLDALYRNTAASLWDEGVASREFHESFDREWKNRNSIKNKVIDLLNRFKVFFSGINFGNI